MSGFDPRTTLARDGVAAEALEGRLEATRYVATTPLAAVRPSAAIRRSPDPGAEQVDQILLGEIFDVAERNGAWCWGQARRDGYVGHVQAAALSRETSAPTHTVCVLRTFAFAEPSIKSAASGPISLNALVTVDETQGALAHAVGVGWIAGRHLGPIGTHARDPAAMAEMFLGTPYLWGGRDSLGLDCSGLVQQALYACGVGAPRDADQQAALGVETRRDSLARNDLVFWRGHVGVMLDEARMVHANGHHMMVAIETLAEATARIGEAGGCEPTAFRRL